jgi:isopentenyl diphosphate isomerase/L-lactate dehydrogenase-like FMN-dependent dehydrogenase
VSAVLSRAYNIDDLHRMARRRLPRGLLDFIDRGSEDDIGLRLNREALDRIKLLPRMLVDCSRRSQETELLGRRHPMPVAVAPTGAAGLAWYHGELEAAKAAAQAGLPYALATAAMTPMETIAEKAGGRLWFQLYVRSDLDLTHQLMDRAKAAGFEGLIVTVDSPVAPNREFNDRNGFGLPFKVNARSVADVARRPGWFLRVLMRYLTTTGMPRYENYPRAHQASVTRGAARSGSMRTDKLSGEDLARLRDRWNGLFLVKGLMHPDDAARASQEGVDAIIVSNHGGRNVDSAPAAIDLLPGAVQAVGGRTPILFDSGIRRGSDIAKALALGAKGVLVGRPVLWGTAVAGAAGALHALNLLKRELDITQAMIGCPGIADIDDRALFQPLHKQRNDAAGRDVT